MFPFDLFSADTLCHLCDSVESPNSCLIHPESGLFSTCISEFDQCYTLLIENVIYRGCVSAKDPFFPNSESSKKCSNPIDCKICSDRNLCNSNTVIDTCIKCNGSESTAECVKDLGGNQVVPCSLEVDIRKSDGCYLNVTADTYMRGCMRNLNLNEQIACDERSRQCQSCKYPNCNRKEQFSSECFKCSGDTDPTCAYSVELASKVNCNDYSKTCVTGIDGNGFTQRECISYDHLHSEFPIGFQTCPKRLCNYKIFPANRLQCYQCEGIHECVSLVNLKSEICNNYMDQCYAYLKNSMCAFFHRKFCK